MGTLGESGYTTDSSNESRPMPHKFNSTKSPISINTPDSGGIQSNNSDSGISQYSSEGSNSAEVAFRHTYNKDTDLEQPGTSNGESHSRAQSVPQTPTKSPRFRRPDSLNIICAECLTVSGLTKTLIKSNSLRTLQNLAVTLKNSCVACPRCNVLKAHFSSKMVSTNGSLSSSSADAYSLDLLLPACNTNVFFFVFHLRRF